MGPAPPAIGAAAGAPAGTTGIGAGMGGTERHRRNDGMGGAAGIGPGNAIGTPAMSATGAAAGAHGAAAGTPTGARRRLHAVVAARHQRGGRGVGPKAMAAPQNPTPAAITLTLNRSKIVIDVDSPSFPLGHSPCTWCSRTMLHQLCLLRLRQLLTGTAEAATRRTGLFPNGDVRPCLKRHLLAGGSKGCQHGRRRPIRARS